MSTEEIAELLNAKRSGSGYLACCPAHNDRHPSLSIDQGDDGKVLLTCRSQQCSASAICSAIGIPVSALFPEKANHHISRTVATYDYRNAAGDLVYQVRRLEPKSFRQFRIVNGQPLAGMEGVQRLPYRLPEVVKAVTEQRPVFICEGEKDCDAVVKLGFPATCNSGGAGKWLQEFDQYFAGAYIVIIADKDEPGRKHAQDVATKLSGSAKTIRVIELPGERVKDAHDWIAAGGKAATLVDIAEAAPLWGGDENSISARLAKRLYTPGIVIPKPAPVFFINQTGVCTPGNLTTISASAKAGKTAFVGAMEAAPFAVAGADCLGVTSSNERQEAVVHIDTEQAIYDHHEGVERIPRRAQAPIPPWFRSYCLTGFSVPDLQSALKASLIEAQAHCGGIHSVFIDGVADLVSDVNDPEESNGFVARLHAMAIEFECPIICVIHVNPGTEKTRGHLGSQLERKSETNLRLEKTDEVTLVWADKNRRAPIIKDHGPRFRWDDVAGMHVACGAVADAIATEKLERLRMQRDDVFSTRKAMRYSDLVSTVKNTLTVSEKTAERRIKDYRQHGLIEKSVAGLFTPKD